MFYILLILTLLIASVPEKRAKSKSCRAPKGQEVVCYVSPELK